MAGALVAVAAALLLAGAARAQEAPARPEVQPFLLPDDWFGRPPVDRPQRAWQRRKSPRTAMLGSFLVPGLGQLYNEREFWAVVAAGVEFYFLGDVLVQQKAANRYRARLHADPSDTAAAVLFELHRDNRIQSTWLLGLAMLLSGLQAFVDAHLFDFEAAPAVQLHAGTPAGPGAMFELRF